EGSVLNCRRNQRRGKVRRNCIPVDDLRAGGRSLITVQSVKCPHVRGNTQSPPYPPMAVLSKPLHPSMRRLLLIKPESFFDEVVDGLLCESQSLRTEVIPEEIESLLDSPHSSLVRVLLQFQLSEGFVEHPYGLLEFPSCRGKDEDVVHIP